MKLITVFSSHFGVTFVIGNKFFVRHFALNYTVGHLHNIEGDEQTESCQLHRRESHWQDDEVDAELPYVGQERKFLQTWWLRVLEGMGFNHLRDDSERAWQHNVEPSACTQRPDKVKAETACKHVKAGE